MKALSEILIKAQARDIGKYIKHEWQLYGYKLARYLDDMERVSLYIKLAKVTDRDVLEQAWDFVKESKPRSKPKLFLWKLKQLRKIKKEKEEK